MNNYILYITDRTSRQYPFEINETGFDLCTSKETVHINNENISSDIFLKLLEDKTAFTLKFLDGTFVSFRSENLTGIQTLHKI